MYTDARNFYFYQFLSRSNARANLYISRVGQSYKFRPISIFVLPLWLKTNSTNSLVHLNGLETAGRFARIPVCIHNHITRGRFFNESKVKNKKIEDNKKSSLGQVRG
jgi:hypothetical protein